MGLLFFVIVSLTLSDHIFCRLILTEVCVELTCNGRVRITAELWLSLSRPMLWKDKYSFLISPQKHKLTELSCLFDYNI